MRSINEFFGSKKPNKQEQLKDDVVEGLLKYWKKNWELSGIKSALSNPSEMWETMMMADEDLTNEKVKTPFWSKESEDAINAFNGPQSRKLTEADLETIPIYHAFKQVVIAAQYIF